VPPPPYIKGPRGEEGNTHQGHELGALLPPMCASTLFLSLSLSPFLLIVWLPEELRRNEGQLHRCTPSCCGNSESDPYRSTSAISARSEIRRSSSFTVCVRVLRGAATCGTESLCRCYRNIKIYTTLRSATLASSSTLVREHNPCVGSTRVCHQISVNRYSITNR
jgi:hypothetical protein